MKRSCVLIGYPRRYDGPILSALVILTSPLITDITKTRNGVRGTESGEREAGNYHGNGKINNGNKTFFEPLPYD